MRSVKKRGSAAVRAAWSCIAPAAGGSPAALVLVGLLCGLINGLLGAGGGIFIVRTAGQLLPRGASRDPRDIYATALAVMLPISAVSTIASARLGVWQGEGAAAMILPALLGGTAGALLLDRLNTNILRMIFSAVAVYSGVAMLRGALR